ncbi:MAG: hypothetical protein KME13_26825 [Myxacorys californica WJT36-NPBG1]|jgi:hypothetical protein|nr:hypothetical protein [Myxacorys californica WJT36-NPBG1]
MPHQNEIHLEPLQNGSGFLLAMQEPRVPSLCRSLHEANSSITAGEVNERAKLVRV